jgi:hypothetical protein
MRWVSVSLCLLLLLTVITGGVIAQGANNQTEEQPTQVRETLGDLTVHTVDWDRQNSSVRLTVSWEGRTPTTVSSIEMLDPESSSQSIGVDQTRILPNEETVIRVDLSDDMDGVVVSTPQSIERGNAIVFTPDPKDSRSVPLMWGVVGGVVLGSGGAAAAAIKRQRSTSEVEKASERGGLL